MKLSNAGILALRGTDTAFRRELSEALGVHEMTMYRYISLNHENLTKAASLILIRRKTGLADEQLLAENINVENSIGS